MNPYLARLRSLNFQNAPTSSTDKTDKTYTGAIEGASATTQEGGFEGFVGVQGRPFLKKEPAPYEHVLTALEARCPALVEVPDWQQAVEDAQQFLAMWGEQVLALGWTARDLFGLHQVPTDPHPSYRRLSRYDETGVLWLLRGRPVIALTATTAAIQHPTGNVTIYRRLNKPALGPLGDSLEDMT